MGLLNYLFGAGQRSRFIGIPYGRRRHVGFARRGGFRNAAIGSLAFYALRKAWGRRALHA